MESKRFLIAAGLSLLVLVVWQWVFPPPPPVRPEAEGVPGQQAEPLAGAEVERTPAPPSDRTEEVSGGATDLDTTLASPSAVSPAVDPIAADSQRDVVLEAPEWRATFSNRGAVLSSLVLRDRRTSSGDEVEMVRSRSRDDILPFGLVEGDGAGLAVNDELFVVEQSTGAVSFRWRDATGAEVNKRYAVDDQGDLTIDVRSTLDGWRLLVGPGVRNPPYAELDDRFQRRSREVVYRSGSELERIQGEELEGPAEIAGSATWVSVQDKYFLSALQRFDGVRSLRAQPVALVGDSEQGLQGYEFVDTGKGQDGPVGLALLLEPEADVLSLTSMWGAKEYVTLRQRGDGLDEAVDWGFFGFIAKPLLYGLRWLHDNVTTNWGWCIVLMTFLLRIVMLPLTHTSFVSMQKMQQVNPQMEAIRAKYRSKLKDKQGRPNFEQQQKMNAEIQQMFRDEGANPAAGCLPLFLQMPIFFAFYQLLAQAVELWGAPWALWINDLSVRDPYYALPLIMGATQLIQQRMMPAPPNPTQRMIMTTMPVMFTVFALNFPSGLVLYWLTNNLLTIVQQGGYNRLKKSGRFGGQTETAKA